MWFKKHWALIGVEPKVDDDDDDDGDDECRLCIYTYLRYNTIIMQMCSTTHQQLSMPNLQPDMLVMDWIFAHTSSQFHSW